MKKYIYGIDIGGTSVKIGLFDVTGELLKKWEIRTDVSNSGKNIPRDIYEAIKKETPNLRKVKGYGIAIPGTIVDGVVKLSVNLGWHDFPFKDAFKELVKNDRVYIENDANIATLGEATHGAAKNYSDATMMTLGTGVGGGVVVHGRIIDGAFGCAGEIGHMFVNPDYKLKCNCGNEGCLETIASATGIKKTFHRFKKDFAGKSSIHHMKNPSAKAIMDASKQGDELALKTIDYVSFYLGYACQVISVTSNPSVIVVGGGVSKAGDFLLDKIKLNFKKLLFTPVKDTKIVLATLGNDAGIYGGAELVKNHD
ncbi:MAG: ROK family glucokinase [Candidatus Izimaplasma sp.]|nr:ROK family glucokinase [Candidatus Izimaplasma bacterium]